MKEKRIFLKLLTPVMAMLVLTGLLLIEKNGITFEERPAMLAILNESAAESTALEQPDARLIVACNQGNETEMAFATTLTDVLKEMRIEYQTIDIYKEPLPDLASIDTLLYCSQSLTPLENDLETLIAWIDTGGHFGVLMTPVNNSAFRVLYRKLGIIEYYDYENYTSLKYISGILPLWGDTVYSENGTLTDFTLAVRLETDCTVHIVSGDAFALPLLWERPVGDGRIVVLDTTLMVDKGGRGYALSALFALEDTLVYPIINAGMVFLDDFPAPQPEGFDEMLKREFGYDIQGFFRNHWWPDMKQLSWDYKIRYTGVLIETYTDNVDGPFTSEGVDDALLKYYTSELLQSGGELGLHGYNHMPLCPEGFNYDGADYMPWPSPLKMSQSLSELMRYGKTLLLNADFNTYVPPSNYLSDLGRQTLLNALPDIKVISGLYLRESGNDALIQEFDEADDGSINVPRITSGYNVDDYMGFITAQELMLHGVFSHFIHPDDMLDSARGGDLDWTTMYDIFREQIINITQTYPDLRFSTASEGAAAVQRYARLRVIREFTAGGLTLTLSPFYDEAWLALRSRQTPATIEGGELFKVADGFYWIKANAPVVHVTWEAET